MDDVQIILSFLWVALMLSNLWGDVLSIIAGDFTPGEIEGTKMTRGMLLGIAIFMTIPIIMIVLSLTLPYSVNRWANIIVAIAIFGFNLFSLRGYPSYQKFTMIVGLGFNVLTVWYAWNWII
ncbi:MAG: DUF6326 family protein [Candidatus Hodarchaeales archaeon]|jgi:hypothetical protein